MRFPMQVIFHCGAHGTEDDRLLKTLLRNKDQFRTFGTAIPRPKAYRTLLKDCLSAVHDGTLTEDERSALRTAILEKKQADRVVLSNAHFFGSQRQSLENNQFYPEAEQRLLAWQQLFPLDQLELFIALRNPATMIPELLSNAAPQRKKEVLNELDPYRVRWSDLLYRLRQVAPKVPVTIWCFEDMPLIWEQVIRDMAGADMQQNVAGGMSLLSAIMSAEGMTRLKHYLQNHPDMTEIHKRRVIAAFLDKFADHDALEEEIDLPGWTEDMIDTLTELYEEDIDQVHRIPGVTLIAP